MSPRPWMPLYIADYLADTADLSVAESGAYMHLIMYYWVNGSLPQDNRSLARISKAGKHWGRICPRIRDRFGPFWSHKRIEQELEKARQRSENGRAAAMRRHCNSHSYRDSTNSNQLEKANGKADARQRLNKLASAKDQPLPELSAEALAKLKPH